MGEREPLSFVAVAPSSPLLDESLFDALCSPNPEDAAQLAIRQLSKTNRISMVSFGPTTVTSHEFLVGSVSVLGSLLRSFVDARREVKVVIENSEMRRPESEHEYYSVKSEEDVCCLSEKVRKFDDKDFVRVTLVIQNYEICLVSLPPFPPFGQKGGPVKANGWRAINAPDAIVGSKAFVLLHFDTGLASETAVMKILARQEIDVEVKEERIVMEKGIAPGDDESEYEYEYEYDEGERSGLQGTDVVSTRSARGDGDSVVSAGRDGMSARSARGDGGSVVSAGRDGASARSARGQDWQVEEDDAVESGRGMSSPRLSERDWQKEETEGKAGGVSDVGSVRSGRGEMFSVNGLISDAADSQSQQSRRRRRRRKKKAIEEEAEKEQSFGHFADSEPLPAEDTVLDENGVAIDDDSPEAEIKRFVAQLRMNIPVLEDTSVFSTLVQQLFYEKWKSGALARTKAVLLELREKLRKKFTDEIQSMKQLVTSNDLTIFVAREEQKMRLLENMAVDTIQKALERRAGAYGNVTTRGLLRTFQTICGDHVTLHRKIRDRRAAIRSETMELRIAQAARLEKLQKYREIAQKVESAESLQDQIHEALNRHEQVEQELTDAEDDRQALLRQLEKVRAILQSRMPNHVK